MYMQIYFNTRSLFGNRSREHVHVPLNSLTCPTFTPIVRTPKKTMDFRTLTHHSQFTFQNPNKSKHLFYIHSISCKRSFLRISFNSFRNLANSRRNRLISACTSPGQKNVRDEFEIVSENKQNVDSVSSFHDEREKSGEIIQPERGGFSANESIWNQMVEIVKFSGPATGLWISGPLMSLIDTVVIGQSSSTELAALGPGTVLCDDLGYLFMFLSIATSNLVATALARQDKDEVQHQISILLFIGLSCGVLMFLFSRLLGPWALTAFTGAKNLDIISAANTYVQIRGLAWPAVLIGWVAQSASLGMKDSFGPLKALAVASAINGIGAVVLCTFLGYGIAGAAWATMASQVVSAYMMVEALNKKGYNGFALSVPSSSELKHIFTIAAPVFMMMMSKVVFYSLLVYFATSMGIQTVAAHQVMIQMYFICAVWAEPLAQTAQSFMPELIYGANRNLAKARMLLKSLIIIGALSGIILGSIGTSVPWLFPQAFSPDAAIIKEMHKVLIPYFITLSVTPSTSGLEGTLLAVRDLKFISLSMSGIVSFGALLLLFLTSRGNGLPVCWWALAAFQWSRFIVALSRLTLPDGVLYSDNLTYHEVGKQKFA